MRDFSTRAWHARPQEWRLACQAPLLGPAAQLAVFDGSACRQSIGVVFVHHGNEAGDALSTPSAVAQLSLQAVELDPLATGHLTQILTGVTLHITPFANKPDNGHELTSNQLPSWAEALRFVNSRVLTFMSLTVAGRSLFPRPMD